MAELMTIKWRSTSNTVCSTVNRAQKFQNSTELGHAKVVGQFWLGLVDDIWENERKYFAGIALIH